MHCLYVSVPEEKEVYCNSSSSTKMTNGLQLLMKPQYPVEFLVFWQGVAFKLMTKCGFDISEFFCLLIYLFPLSFADPGVLTPVHHRAVWRHGLRLFLSCLPTVADGHVKVIYDIYFWRVLARLVWLVVFFTLLAFAALVLHSVHRQFCFPRYKVCYSSIYFFLNRAKIYKFWF
jgi:hypothetical protein